MRNPTAPAPTLVHFLLGSFNAESLIGDGKAFDSDSDFTQTHSKTALTANKRNPSFLHVSCNREQHLKETYTMPSQPRTIQHQNCDIK